MDENETVNNLLGIISGNETTATLLGNGLYALLQNPAELARLRADRSLMRPAIEEVLRFEPAINFILRVAIADFRLGDIEIPAGFLVIGLVCTINSDPLKFDRPDVFDAAVRRTHSRSSAAVGMSVSAPLSRGSRRRLHSPHCSTDLRRSSWRARRPCGATGPTSVDSRPCPPSSGWHSRIRA